MRTTLDIDDDVLQAVKELAAARKMTTGQVLSDLARKTLRSDLDVRLRSGVPLLPHRRGSRRTSVEDVERWLDEE